MVELAFGIAGYATCAPFPDSDVEVLWTSEAGTHDDEAPPVPALLRRRVTPIGRAVLRAAWALPQLARARFVFASRHGEFDRTLTMLQEVADDDGPSPADFSLSVHNALPGLLSICTRNQGGHTALAAGADSFGFGLLEAAACLMERPEDPIMLAYYDDGLPPGYPDTTQTGAEASLAFALMLVRPDQVLRHVIMAATPAAISAPDEPAASVFLRFLRTTALEASARGERMSWSWRHV